MVANPERGEEALRVTRGDETKDYILKVTMNASAAMQKRVGKTFGELWESMGKIDLAAAREMAYMLLQKYHRDEIKTVEQAGDLIDDAGFEQFLEAFGRLMKINSGEGTGNPPIAQPTTGAPSTSAPAGPA